LLLTCGERINTNFFCFLGKKITLNVGKNESITVFTKQRLDRLLVEIFR